MGNKTFGRWFSEGFKFFTLKETETFPENINSKHSKSFWFRDLRQFWDLETSRSLLTYSPSWVFHIYSMLSTPRKDYQLQSNMFCVYHPVIFVGRNSTQLTFSTVHVHPISVEDSFPKGIEEELIFMDFMYDAFQTDKHHKKVKNCEVEGTFGSSAK
ncbi:CLUMA_CG004199, isoform A [Clunio marinus]|uniref:CLUMA_CG004199, isoform A n=1 Tax=Clunio marinus TaxID=568069 RepID=A0A1J1HR22_9DIPT|nr:CLUMA_CG004199, isoform A [Clunio marinus]